MDSELFGKQVAVFFVEKVLDELEEAASLGHFQTHLISEVAGFSNFMKNQALLTRAKKLLLSAPDKAFLNALPSELDRRRSIPSVEKFIQRHPSFEDNDPLNIARKLSDLEHISLCFERKFTAAMNAAKNDSDKEEVALTQALLGDCEGAIQIIQNEGLPEFRQRNVLQMIALELFRQDNLERSEWLIKEIETNYGYSAWDRLQLAIGFVGHNPWLYYPYPDW